MIAEELRSGTGDTVFMICGAGGSAAELAGLAHALRSDARVVALVPLRAEGETEVATTVEAMAAAAAALVRSHQQHGPYRLLGYSLGGIIALETGLLLRASGERVSFTGIVDSLFDRRHWPTRVFLRASMRRAAFHGSALIRMPPARARRELVERAGRLAGEVRGRLGARDVTDTEPAMTVAEANYLALARWRPRVFDERITLFTSDGRDWGCDLAELWRPWLPRLEVRRIPASHLEMVREEGAIERLSSAVDEALAASASLPLRALVATTFRWSGAARLAVELRSAGCEVEAVAPRGSALHAIAAVDRSYALGLLDSIASLRRAIESSSADLVIPFDDRTRRALHRIHADADPTSDEGARLRERIERSLGPADRYPMLYSRAAIMGAASECGIRCPPTVAVRSAGEIEQWLARNPGPAVVKTDGSWGGRETRVIASQADARKAWRQLSRRPSVARCLKRLLLERDPWPLRNRLSGDRPQLSVQAYVEGTPGNATVSCLDGEVLGAVLASVLRSQGPTGPSTVLQLAEQPQMTLAAEAMVHRLRMSGLVGFDFVLETGTGRAHLIEVNPRATPTSHLISADGVDLLTSLRAALGFAGPPPRTATYRNGRVALFPQELQRDPEGATLLDAFHDVPWHAPDLVRHELASLRSHGASEIRNRLDGAVSAGAVAPTDPSGAPAPSSASS